LILNLERSFGFKNNERFIGNPQKTLEREVQAEMHCSVQIKRNVLTESQAVSIYMQRPQAEECFVLRTRNISKSRLLGERYGVSPKTVRDIWNRRTWMLATLPLYLCNTYHFDSTSPSGSDEVCFEIMYVFVFNSFE
jgi:hypothetical protein